jgi:hypothetical protein
LSKISFLSPQNNKLHENQRNEDPRNFSLFLLLANRLRSTPPTPSSLTEQRASKILGSHDFRLRAAGCPFGL